MTDLFATIAAAEKGLAYPRMSLLCRHSPGYGCEFCRWLNEPAPAPIARARTTEGKYVDASRARAHFTRERLEELFAYDPASGALTRRDNGDEVVATNNYGYRWVWIEGSALLVHRIVWRMMTGEWPVAMVDHIDGCRTNNRWTNLRAADHSEGMSCNVNVLALDLATKCGWAYRTRDGKQRSGVERFAPGKGGHNGQRWLAMRQWLTEAAREMGGVHVVYFEDVKRHVSNLSARTYCGYLAILEAWCATNNVPMVGVGVGTVKKAWTGKGNATKEDMIAEAERRGFKPSTDDEADALAILSYAITQEQ